MKHITTLLRRTECNKLSVSALSHIYVTHEDESGGGFRNFLTFSSKRSTCFSQDSLLLLRHRKSGQATKKHYISQLYLNNKQSLTMTFFMSLRQDPLT
jgi:hypothetical protein